MFVIMEVAREISFFSFVSFSLFFSFRTFKSLSLALSFFLTLRDRGTRIVSKNAYEWEEPENFEALSKLNFS